MIKLTDRLRTISKEINKGETVADIGTDHGFLPIFLWEQGICHKVIMTDVSADSLGKARDNCAALHPEKSFDLRLGNGMEVIETGEVDVIVMAGMGGILMTEILKSDVSKSKSFKKLILQPRNNIGFLRHWLLNNGFSITKEQLVREGKYICEVITVIPKEIAVTKNMSADRIEYQYPHSLIDFKGPLTKEYLSNKLRIERDILRSMEKSLNTTKQELRSRKYRIEYLERLIGKL